MITHSLFIFPCSADAMYVCWRRWCSSPCITSFYRIAGRCSISCSRKQSLTSWSSSMLALMAGMEMLGRLRWNPGVEIIWCRHRQKYMPAFFPNLAWFHKHTLPLFVWDSAVDVFLDSRRLQEGMHFLDKFSIALINSVGKPDSPSALLHVVMCQFPFAIL